MVKAFIPFKYVGSKAKLLVQPATKKWYPEPQHDTIVEVCAGGAAYSMQHGHKDSVKHIYLVEPCAEVAAIWKYLKKCTAKEILSLPNLRIGQRASEFDLCKGARNLIDMNLRFNGNDVRPSNRKKQAESRWGKKLKHALAEKIKVFRKITVFNMRFEQFFAKRLRRLRKPCTYFVDPPYQLVPGGYQYDSGQFPYEALRAALRRRRGQLIVTEGALCADHDAPLRIPPWFRELYDDGGQKVEFRPRRNGKSYWELVACEDTLEEETISELFDEEPLNLRRFPRRILLERGKGTKRQLKIKETEDSPAIWVAASDVDGDHRRPFDLAAKREKDKEKTLPRVGAPT